MRTTRSRSVPATAALLAALAVVAAPSGTASAAPPGIPRVEFQPRAALRAGPGRGYLTPVPSMLRPLRQDVRLLPLLTVGDTLASADPEAGPFAFAPRPEGVSVYRRDDGGIEAFVTHSLEWRSGWGGAILSRLLLDPANAGVLAADYVLDGSEGYSDLGAASLVSTWEGFLRPQLLVNETTTYGPRRGVVAAVDVRDATVADLPWLGRLPHHAATVLPLTTGRLALLMTGGDEAAGEPSLYLYLYLADTDSDLLGGRGRLYVFRGGTGTDGRPARNPAAFRKTGSATGRFVPVGTSAPDEPLAWAEASRLAGAFAFVRLGDVTPDRQRPNAFYLSDRGQAGLRDYSTARPYTANGRVYRMELDPFDPTLVRDLRVVLDGDEGDDIYRPDDLDTDGEVLMIQEDPDEGRSLHPGRILRCDLGTWQVDALAVCAERDVRGRELPQGVGGAWATSGICDAGAVFGRDSWLVTVQARTIEERMWGRREFSGQLVLLRGPRWKPPREASRRESRAPGEQPRAGSPDSAGAGSGRGP